MLINKIYRIMFIFILVFRLFLLLIGELMVFIIWIWYPNLTINFGLKYLNLSFHLDLDLIIKQLDL